VIDWHKKTKECIQQVSYVIQQIPVLFSYRTASSHGFLAALMLGTGFGMDSLVKLFSKTVKCEHEISQKSI